VLGHSPGGMTAVRFTLMNPDRVAVPDCGHIPHLEHPGQFLAEFLPFLASQPGCDMGVEEALA
jgi:hypothetical protein